MDRERFDLPRVGGVGVINSLEQIFKTLSSRERKLLPLVVVFIAVLSLLEAVGIGMLFPLMQVLTDKDALQRNEFLYVVSGMFSANEDNLHVYLALLILFVFVSKNIFSVVINSWNYYFCQSISARISVDLFNRYIHAPLVWHIQSNSSEKIRNIETSTTQAIGGVLLPTLSLMSEMIVIAGMTAILVIVDPVITLVLISLLIGTGGMYYVLSRKRTSTLGANLHNLLAQLLLIIQQGFGGLRELRVMGQESSVIQIFKQRRNDAMRIRSMIGVMQILPRYVFETIIVIVVVVSLLLLLQVRDESVAISMLGLLGVTAMRMLPSANRIVECLQQIRVNSPAVTSVFSDMTELNNADYELDQANWEEDLIGEDARGIAIKNVSFMYPGKLQPALDKTSFDVKWGQSVGLVGVSGSGKSTLIDLVAGLLQPSSGAVFVNGKDIRKDVRKWQERIGYVPQSVFVLNESLRRNIALGIPDEQVDAKKLNDAICAACLEDWVSGLDSGLGTSLGEWGQRVSGGQRQRVGIARALYRDPDVLLLDEATSALDTETEAKFSRILEGMKGRKTVFVVAHRLSTVQRCDTVLFMKDGKVVDSGSFNELLGKNSEFARMVKLGSIFSQETLSDISERS